MDTLLVALVAVLMILLLAVIVLLLRPKKLEMPAIEDLEKKLRYALASADSVKEVQEILEDMPREFMQSITGSLGKRTGKLNELMATFELTQYDRLFYLGDLIDFVGVKYDEGIDFIEVKTGRFRLTEDEKKLRELIVEGRVNYVPLLVERIGIAEEVETSE